MKRLQNLRIAEFAARVSGPGQDSRIGRASGSCHQNRDQATTRPTAHEHIRVDPGGLQGRGDSRRRTAGGTNARGGDG